MTLTAHVKHLIIAGVVAVVTLVVLWKYFAYAEGQGHDQKILAEEKLKNDLAIAKAQAQTTASDTAILQQQIAALQASNSALAGSLSALRVQLASQRQQDATASPTDLSVRWRAIVGVGAITPQAQGLLVDLPAAHETVDRLEQLPEVQAELRQVEANGVLKDQAFAAQVKVLSDTQAELTTCKAVTKDADAVCAGKLEEQAAKARKHTIWWAVGAFIGGLVAGRRI